MNRQPPGSTRTATRFPYPSLFRSSHPAEVFPRPGGAASAPRAPRGTPLFDQALRTGSVYMINIEINGEARALDVAEDTPLLWVLRDELGLTGTTFGRGLALSGPCTVHFAALAPRDCVPSFANIPRTPGTTH